MNNTMLKVGDYIRVTRAISDLDKQHVGKILKVIRIDRGNIFTNIKQYKDFDYYFVKTQLEIIPEEIYNSPLFQLMQEEN